MGDMCTKTEDIPTIVLPGIAFPDIVAPAGGTLRRSGEQAPGDIRSASLIVAVRIGRVSNASNKGGFLTSGHTVRTSARRRE